MNNAKRYSYLNAINDVLTYDSLDAARKDAQIEAESNDIQIEIRSEGKIVATVIPEYWNNTELDPRWMD